MRFTNPLPCDGPLLAAATIQHSNIVFSSPGLTVLVDLPHVNLLPHRIAIMNDTLLAGHVDDKQRLAESYLKGLMKK